MGGLRETFGRHFPVTGGGGFLRYPDSRPLSAHPEPAALSVPSELAALSVHPEHR